jgi:hypothetical protein
MIAMVSCVIYQAARRRRAVHPSAAALFGVSARPPRRGGRVYGGTRLHHGISAPVQGENAAVTELERNISSSHHRPPGAAGVGRLLPMNLTVSALGDFLSANKFATR